MIVNLLAEHHLEFLSLKGGCRGSSESTHVKMPHCWKSHAEAQIIISLLFASGLNASLQVRLTETIEPSLLMLCSQYSRAIIAIDSEVIPWKKRERRFWRR